MRDRPVYPHLMSHCQVQNETETWPGMTLREYAAVAAMQGLLSSDSDTYVKADGTQCKSVAEVQEVVAQLSMGYADALLASLEEKQ